ncbi:metallophosphoesterase family protein [Nitrospirillum pindoramense]|uniref:Calcineurin-like phosphoesterase family protein n=1 Tax=Nitrospirillum amazonense TaxID=28077 RepID=A0A560HH99_9PROT|nr:metallophosphoesterase family protein [Nitrospirillum amazonense]TWB45832.1 calcineurin-like phosphoesterase family protein [Nitrospirillum amazonense]
MANIRANISSVQQPIVAVGDPHGNWRPLLECCAQVQPSAVIIVGDCELNRPLRQELATLVDAGVTLAYVPGNHDADRREWWDNLVGDHPGGNLHGRAMDLGGLRVAGLGGVYAERVYWPKAEEDPAPTYRDRQSWIRANRRNLASGEIPLKYRATIFPEDHAAVAAAGKKGAVDVLVTHEAPLTHRYGFAGIGLAARACRARLVVHGHHHEGYEGELAGPGGCRVKGLGLAEPWVVEVPG